jgi:hypothetical protein
LADYALFMPEAWLGEDYAERRLRCRVPEDLEFKTKCQLLSELVSKLDRSGNFQVKYVGLGPDFGYEMDLLDSLPPALIYFAEVPPDCQVFLGPPGAAPGATSGAPDGGEGYRPWLPSTAKLFPVKAIAGDQAVRWSEYELDSGDGATATIKDARVKVVKPCGGVPGQEIWLYAQRLEDGTAKYALSNASLAGSIAGLRLPAKLRWSMDRCFRQCHDDIGMGHYEVRTWHGWRRHMLLVAIAQLFVSKLRGRWQP